MVRVAIMGATGAVGQEFLRLFEERSFPVDDLRLLASERSAGKKMEFRGQPHTVEAVSAAAFDGVTFAFFSAGASRSREFLQPALNAGATVIDNSSAFRMDQGVPLVVPEVNWETIGAGDRLIANPNCTAAILVTAVAPLLRKYPVERIVVSTYQSASGAGAAAMEELKEGTRALLEGRSFEPQILPYQYAFNLFSHNTPIGADGHNDEEAKVMAETRKMLGLPELKMNVTCVRVPVLRAHCESVTLEFAQERPSEVEARALLERAPGVKVVDDRAANLFPMPSLASGQNDVLVGRIRHDPSHERGLCLFVSGDQLLKGAALNAVQIAERLMEDRGTGRAG